MSIEICERRQQILDAKGHTLVFGGPGSGKTTIALLKAVSRIESGLEQDQSILFLSFSKAAVARVSEASQMALTKELQKRLNIQTFHSLFWEILRTHGYLIGSTRRLIVLQPQDERSLSNAIGFDETPENHEKWALERERLFKDEGKVAFDLFAPKTFEILSRSEVIQRIVTNRYPLIIVDEAQDTSPDQWSCIKLLARHSQMLCLADLSQQIFDFIPGVDPKRIDQIEDDLSPIKVDLGTDNNRSRDSEIVVFGNDLINRRSRSKGYRGISQMNFAAQADKRDRAIRQSIGIVSSIVKQITGEAPKSIAIITSFERGVNIVSKALREGGKPISHKVHFDEAATLLASRFLAFLMEPKDQDQFEQDLSEALELLATMFRAKGTKGGREVAGRFHTWAQNLLDGGTPPRAKLFKELAQLLHRLQVNSFVGNPRKDWLSVRGLLRNTGVSEFIEIDKQLQYLMTFNRGKRIASGLSSAWEAIGHYASARRVLDAALVQDHILSGDDSLSGIHVMNVHKSKGKEFDAVIILRCPHISPFVWPKDTEPFLRSRKILRVAVTRARYHTMILNQVYPSCPILSCYNL